MQEAIDVEGLTRDFEVTQNGDREFSDFSQKLCPKFRTGLTCFDDMLMKFQSLHNISLNENELQWPIRVLNLTKSSIEYMCSNNARWLTQFFNHEGYECFKSRERTYSLSRCGMEFEETSMPRARHETPFWRNTQAVVVLKMKYDICVRSHFRNHSISFRTERLPK